MVLGLILMSTSNDLAFHYNSITVPFTGLCSFYLAFRGARGPPFCELFISTESSTTKRMLLYAGKLDYYSIDSVVIWGDNRNHCCSSDHSEIYRPVTCRCMCADVNHIWPSFSLPPLLSLTLSHASCSFLSCPLSSYPLSARPSPCLLRTVWSVSDWRAQSEESPPSS